MCVCVVRGGGGEGDGGRGRGKLFMTLYLLSCPVESLLGLKGNYLHLSRTIFRSHRGQNLSHVKYK